MTAHQQGGKVLRMSEAPAEPDDLAYRIELWDEAGGGTVERVLARAFSAGLARAMFTAARGEYPDRRITLRRGEKIITDTAG